MAGAESCAGVRGSVSGSFAEEGVARKMYLRSFWYLAAGHCSRRAALQPLPGFSRSLRILTPSALQQSCTWTWNKRTSCQKYAKLLRLPNSVENAFFRCPTLGSSPRARRRTVQCEKCFCRLCIQKCHRHSSERPQRRYVEEAAPGGTAAGEAPRAARRGRRPWPRSGARSRPGAPRPPARPEGASGQGTLEAALNPAEPAWITIMIGLADAFSRYAKDGSWLPRCRAPEVSVSASSAGVSVLRVLRSRRQENAARGSEYSAPRCAADFILFGQVRQLHHVRVRRPLVRPRGGGAHRRRGPPHELRHHLPPQPDLLLAKPSPLGLRPVCHPNGPHQTHRGVCPRSPTLEGGKSNAKEHLAHGAVFYSAPNTAQSEVRRGAVGKREALYR